MQPLPDSVPADVKCFLKEFPPILCTGDVMPTPTNGVECHIHTGSHLTVLQNPVALKQKSLRPCGDYCRLNLVTTSDKYPLPNIQDLFNGLHGCNVFSKIDLVKGYHQIPIAAADIPKSVTITPFGLFKYFFTPFGFYGDLSAHGGPHC